MVYQNISKNIYDIEAAQHAAKPCADAFSKFLNYYDIDPQAAVFLMIILKNIQTAEKLGISSFHVQEGEDEKEGCLAVKNLAEFLLSKI